MSSTYYNIYIIYINYNRTFLYQIKLLCHFNLIIISLKNLNRENFLLCLYILYRKYYIYINNDENSTNREKDSRDSMLKKMTHDLLVFIYRRS